jgi:hypothetical protein
MAGIPEDPNPHADEIYYEEEALRRSSALRALITEYDDEDSFSEAMNNALEEGSEEFDKLLGENWPVILGPALDSIFHVNTYPHYSDEDPDFRNSVSIQLVIAGFQLGEHPGLATIVPKLASRIKKFGIVDQELKDTRINRYILTCYGIGMNYRSPDPISENVSPTSDLGPFEGFIRDELDLSDLE